MPKFTPRMGKRVHAAATFDRAYQYPLARIMPLRPVYRRLVTGQTGPPTDEEKADAILLLAEPYQDDVGDEAFRILDEYGR